MHYTILISGGTGLIGSYLSENLKRQGYTISHLSRNKTGKEKYKTYKWNIKKGYIEEGAIEQADAIIHLAGTSVAGKRWTKKRKEEILKSRTESTHLLFKKVSEINNKIKVFISASGISIYGVDTGDKLITEESEEANDFLAKVTKEWEASVDQLKTLGIRVVKLRIGIVLALEGGALPKLALPVKFGLGAALGTGKQYYSWIHIEDLIGIFIDALKKDSYNEVYNAVAPNPVTNKDFTKSIATILKRPLILPNVPSVLLKVALGELAGIVLGGNKISSKKVQNEGFKFKYEHLDSALKALLLSQKVE